MKAIHTEDPFSRQSFLGENSQSRIEQTIIGIAGLGGGGSHIAQQLAHLGFLNFVIYDGDHVESSNLNRLVGATEGDVINKTPKIEIARRLISGIRPTARIQAIQSTWQESPNPLKSCDLVFGCVDGFDQRRQLEATARRYFIPLIDIGMDVHATEEGQPVIAGQVILSMPGHSCMHCMGFLNESNLAKEAGNYGDAGINPQVVWSNGLLASTAVGLAVDLITDWSKSLRGSVYLSYRGNSHSLTEDPTFAYAPKVCKHYLLKDIGVPNFTKL